MTATVLDKGGSPVTNLTRDDFAITEDGVPQQVALFNLDDATPLSLVLLVDTSGSMVDKIDEVQDALNHLINQAKPEDELALLEFSTGVDVLNEFGAPPKEIRRSVRRLRPRGGTALYDAIVDGLQTLGGARYRKRAILVVTDGNDNQSQSSLKQVVDRVTKEEAIVYCLGIGHGSSGSFGHDSFGARDTVDIRALRAIAEPSGGRAELLENAHRGGVDFIDRAVLSISRELRQQYTIGYYPTNRARDGSYRRITVTTTNARVTIRARKGYLAPAA